MPTIYKSELIHLRKKLKKYKKENKSLKKQLREEKTMNSKNN